MMELHPAHIRKNPDGSLTEQAAARHCRAAASYARASLAECGLGETGYLAGLIHDMGKFTEKFRDYIERAERGEKVIKGSVNHTFAAAVFLFERYHRPGADSMSISACELIACAAGSHHGLFDGISPEGADGYARRLGGDRESLCYDEAVSNFLHECADESELDDRFGAARLEVSDFIGRALSQNREESGFTFAVSMAQRMLLSALIDADRRDTAEFMSGKLLESAGRDIRCDWGAMLAYAENRIRKMGTSGGINAARRKISDMCREFAEKPGGIYRLTVPTGAGKTLAALRYAFAHAKEYSKRRVFFIIPLLSVIDQNAGVIRDHVENQSLILEHHSNIVRESRGDGELDIYELLSESWDCPIVISTLVQLLDTMFSDKTACIRRMNALAQSVIVIDEVQSIPLRTVSLFNEAVNCLAGLFGATVVLCSATQPGLENTKRPLRPNGDIVPYDPELWRVFKRNEVYDRLKPSGYSEEEAADFITEQAEKCESVLMICNTRAAAKKLYGQLDVINRGSDEPYLLLHLSAAMCPKHRAETLALIKTNLGKRRLVCVSTQIAEAGIDFSFECVIRSLAGLDNAAQSAGRNNRNGEFNKICGVYIINLKFEKLGPLRIIEDAQEAYRTFLYRFSLDKSRYGGDMLSNKAVEEYYRLLYQEADVSKKFDYPVPALDSSIFGMLSANRDFARRSHDRVCRLVNQAFRTAGENFSVFDDAARDVIVPYDSESRKIIADLYSERAKHDLAFLAKTLERAKPYTVRVFEYQRRALEEAGGLHDGGKDIPFISVLPRFYDENTGLLTQNDII